MISFQNGVSNVDLLKAQAAQGDGAARHGARSTSPRSATAAGTRASPARSGPRIMPSPATLAERIGNGPGRLHLSDDMVGVAWGKLLINLNNAVNALSGKTLLEQLSDRNYRRVFAASQIEALEHPQGGGDRAGQDRPDRRRS